MTFSPPRLLIVLLMLAQPALAERTITVSSGPQRTAVVELYTSEGCSSCPPADRWLAELVKIPRDELDVLALAFHVDYWDYIGWKDEFADPRFTKRQRRLANANKQRTIYTPGFFVDGVEARGTGRIVQEIKRANQSPSMVQLQLTAALTPQTYRLRLEAEGLQDREMRVQFIVFEDGLSNQVERGENAGSLLNHAHVVRYLSRPKPLQSTTQYEIPIDPRWNEPNLGIAAVVVSAENSYIQSVYTSLKPN